MCIIYYLPPNALPDPVRFKTAVKNNPHGWGLMFPNEDMSSLSILKGLFEGQKEKKEDWEGDAVDMLYDHLIASSDRPRALHLRFTTVGETVKSNCHPFIVAASKNKTSGEDDNLVGVAFMHNGTFADFRCEDRNKLENAELGFVLSDTARFNEDVVRPLFGAQIRANQHPFDQDVNDIILDKFAGATNKLLFMDKNGRVYFTNEKAGTRFTHTSKLEETGIWVSNTYSFNAQHRNNTTITTHYTSRGSGAGDVRPGLNQDKNRKTELKTPTVPSHQSSNNHKAQTQPPSLSARRVNVSSYARKFSTDKKITPDDLLYITKEGLEELILDALEYFDETAHFPDPIKEDMDLKKFVAELQEIAYTYKIKAESLEKEVAKLKKAEVKQREEAQASLKAADEKEETATSKVLRFPEQNT